MTSAPSGKGNSGDNNNRARVHSDRPEKNTAKSPKQQQDHGKDEGKKMMFAMAWECHEKLGSGQFADVFRATEKRPRDRSNPRVVGMFSFFLISVFSFS